MPEFEEAEEDYEEAEEDYEVNSGSMSLTELSPESRRLRRYPRSRHLCLVRLRLVLGMPRRQSGSCEESRKRRRRPDIDEVFHDWIKTHNRADGSEPIVGLVRRLVSPSEPDLAAELFRSPLPPIPPGMNRKEYLKRAALVICRMKPEEAKKIIDTIRRLYDDFGGTPWEVMNDIADVANLGKLIPLVAECCIASL